MKQKKVSYDKNDPIYTLVDSILEDLSDGKEASEKFNTGEFIEIDIDEL